MPRSAGHEVTGERRRPLRRVKKSKIHRDSSAGSEKMFFGVRQTRLKKWVVGIQDNRLRQTFGIYSMTEEAVLAYDEVARKLWEKEAITNFLTDSPPTLPSELFDFRCSVLFANMDEL
ncbi:hypothetical protein ACJRO7_029931 [Eucalyptus globulus]|uniref:AP2/ERF domain-containing protein n=1 Tax=Eucalyptus globulus TaxID=34317 RepID=A0ABD3JKU0_EUCGL